MGSLDEFRPSFVPVISIEEKGREIIYLLETIKASGDQMVEGLDANNSILAENNRLIDRSLHTQKTLLHVWFSSALRNLETWEEEVGEGKGFYWTE